MRERFRPELSRRELIKLGALAGAGVALWRPAAARAESSKTAGLLTRAIPSTGEKIPVVGLGTNQYGVSSPDELAARKAVLERMAELGATVIDTAPAYGSSESVLGSLLTELGSRERFFVATKVTAEGDDAKGAETMLRGSFEKLGTARLDLVQVHNLNGVDAVMPRLLEWKKAGKIRYVGITTSNPSAHGRMVEFMRRHPLDFIQVDYSLGNRLAAAEVLPLAQERKMAVLINLPLGGRRGGSLFTQVTGREVPAWAAEFEAKTWAQFFLKYCVSHPAVTCAIPGTTKVAHLEDNLLAAQGRLPDAAARKRMEEFWDAKG